MCRACHQSHRATASSPPPLPAPDDHPAVLLLRVWHEDDQLRCRLMQAADASSPPAGVGVAQGVDAICDAVRGWLLQQ
jgi:hypothetical protein